MLIEKSNKQVYDSNELQWLRNWLAKSAQGA